MAAVDGGLRARSALDLELRLERRRFRLFDPEAGAYLPTAGAETARADSEAARAGAAEAKARFSEVLRQVREGKTVTISYRGEPAAEIRPVPPKKRTLDERLEQMERVATLVGSKSRKRNFRTIERRPGALDRFLAESERVTVAYVDTSVLALCHRARGRSRVVKWPALFRFAGRRANGLSRLRRRRAARSPRR